MNIYTRTGDDGTTGLIGGSRVRKSDPRIECSGTIDELNAALGLAAVSAHPDLSTKLRLVQAELFVIGSQLATPPGSAKTATLPELQSETIARLEHEIDSAEADLPPLKNFILPGGSPAAAFLHLARTICRRAERLLVDRSKSLSIPPLVLTYFNRLSDWLFVQARWSNHITGVKDVPWIWK